MNNSQNTINSLSTNDSISSVFWTDDVCDITTLTNQKVFKGILWKFSKRQKIFVICKLTLINNYMLYTKVVIFILISS